MIIKWNAKGSMGSRGMRERGSEKKTETFFFSHARLVFTHTAGLTKTRQLKETLKEEHLEGGSSSLLFEKGSAGIHEVCVRASVKRPKPKKEDKVVFFLPLDVGVFFFFDSPLSRMDATEAQHFVCASLRITRAQGSGKNNNRRTDIFEAENKSAHTHTHTYTHAEAEMCTSSLSLLSFFQGAAVYASPRKVLAMSIHSFRSAAVNTAGCS